jgi:NhaP-type Na+/H+ or K+/H+ antiporter
VAGLIAAAPGFEFGDIYALGVVFVGVATVVAIGALSHQHERAFSASLIYLVLGLGAAVALEVLGVHWLDPVDDAEVVERLAEFCVIVALFSTGLKLDRELSWAAWASVARLLAVVMPLTIAAIALFGTQVMGLSLAAAIVLGGALAPTDPVLAGDIGVGRRARRTRPSPTSRSRERQG